MTEHDEKYAPILTELKQLRIGYVPYTADLSGPADRRRFCYWAKKRGLAFEIANTKERYDIVVVTPAGDITEWAEYNGPGTMIYEQVDSYLAVRGNEPKAVFRGLAKYVFGHTRRLRLSYWDAIADICRRADAVICATDEQRSAILAYCPNVHVILDVHDDVVTVRKQDYAAGDVFNLVWEGLPENLVSFREIGPVLRELGRKRPIALHLVTDLDWKPHLNRYGRRHSVDVAREIFEPSFLYAWNKNLSGTIISSCDLAVIPIALHLPLKVGKPENKLILFWRLGVPVVVSRTPAYARAMDRAGLDMTYVTPDEWMAGLEYYMTNESARRSAAQSGLRTAEGSYYGVPATLAKWDALAASVLEGRKRPLSQTGAGG